MCTSITRAAAFIAAILFALALGPATAAAAISSTSKVTVSADPPYWHGKILSSELQGVRSCERDRVVKMLGRRDGKDLLIGTDRSNRSGRWVIPDDPMKGIYYAKVTARRAGDKPGCDKDRSAIVHHDPFDADSVTGAGGFDFVWDARFDAHSGPLGENPTGTAHFAQRFFLVSGPVTCLTVDRHRAVIGGQDTDGGGYLFLVEDNAGGGTPDRLVYAFVDDASGPAVCPSPEDFPFGEFPIDVSLTGGDLVVHDGRPSR